MNLYKYSLVVKFAHFYIMCKLIPDRPYGYKYTH